MKVLVTGSSGFIGKNLVAELERRGHQVIDCDPKTGWGDVLYYHDSMPPFDVPFDAIFHLACVNQMQATLNPEENLRVNAYGTKVMADFAARMGARLFYTSTASVYGNAELIPTPEDAALEPLSDYGVAKLAGEHFVKNSGARYTILRLSNVYGPHQTSENPYCGVIGKFFEQARAGKALEVIGDGNQTRDFTYVGDVVSNLVGMAEQDKSFHVGKTFNLSYGDEVKVLELAKKIIDVSGAIGTISFIPPRSIDGVSRRCLDNRLGHAFFLRCGTSLDVGLQRTHSWFTSST